MRMMHKFNDVWCAGQCIHAHCTVISFISCEMNKTRLFEVAPNGHCRLSNKFKNKFSLYLDPSWSE